MMMKSASTGKGKPPRCSNPPSIARSQEQQEQQQRHHTLPFVWRMTDSSSMRDDEASSDFFSPPPPAAGSCILPRSHDTSWIGARQSPIPSFDNEDTIGFTPLRPGSSQSSTSSAGDDDGDGCCEEDEENNYNNNNNKGPITTTGTAAGPSGNYHGALHDSQFYREDETAHLLEAGRTGKDHAQYASILRPGHLSIHPLWHTGATSEERTQNARKYAKYYTKHNTSTKKCQCHWGNWLVILWGISWATLFVYDVWLYSSSSEEQKDEGEASEWSQALFQASRVNTLIRFGGMQAQLILDHNQYWRLLSSLLFCGSLWEWLWVLLAWNLCILYSPDNSQHYPYEEHHHQPGSSPRMIRLWSTHYGWWWGTFWGSALTGQLWMMAWDGEAITAMAATWGTCGILVASGREESLFAASLAVALAWWELPANSVFGIAGACLFGYMVSMLPSQPQQSQKTTTSNNQYNSNAKRKQYDEEQQQRPPILRLLLLLALIVAPVFSIAFGSSSTLPPYQYE